MDEAFSRAAYAYDSQEPHELPDISGDFEVEIDGMVFRGDLPSEDEDDDIQFMSSPQTDIYRERSEVDAAIVAMGMRRADELIAKVKKAAIEYVKGRDESDQSERDERDPAISAILSGRGGAARSFLILAAHRDCEVTS